MLLPRVWLLRSTATFPHDFANLQRTLLAVFFLLCGLGTYFAVACRSLGGARKKGMIIDSVTAWPER